MQHHNGKRRSTVFRSKVRRGWRNRASIQVFFDPREACWGVFELILFVSMFNLLGILDRHYIFFPSVHWTRMKALRDQIVERQPAPQSASDQAAPALGFLDRDLPRLHSRHSPLIESESATSRRLGENVSKSFHWFDVWHSSPTQMLLYWQNRTAEARPFRAVDRRSSQFSTNVLTLDYWETDTFRSHQNHVSRLINLK
jgi:hypothetical protein